MDYRKSGLSLNHIQGCPLDCAYCIRHTYGVWEMTQPRALMPDDEAVRQLVEHPYFQAHHTPVQIFNRATDPFLPRVKGHLFNVVEDLDARGLTNHVLVITRYRVDPEDCDRLNRLANIRVTILVTYSGISDKRIEPVKSEIAEKSLKTLYAHADRYRVILYWRPLVPGLNDTPEHMAKAVELSHHAHGDRFHGPVLPRRDRRLLQGQQAPGTVQGHRPPEDRPRDSGAPGPGSVRRRRRRAVVPQDQLLGLVRPRSTRLQRALRRPGTVRHLPGQAAPAVRTAPPGPDRRRGT